MNDALATDYLNLALPSPLVMSCSPLWKDLDAIRRAEDAGAGAIVPHSLFEQLTVDSQSGAPPRR